MIPRNEKTMERGVKGRRASQGGFTLTELLSAIAIIGVLSALAFTGARHAMNAARAARAMLELREITGGTLAWAADNQDRLPAPIYASASGRELPEYANTTGTGLWLDGVVFKTLYPELDPSNPPNNRASSGGHLVGTVFESIASVKADPDETDWYRHSYAMNKNLVYDEVSSRASDPYLTEKTRMNITKPNQALLYVDCAENVVDRDDLEEIKQAAKRYQGKFVLAAFVDGHVEKMHPLTIPSGSVDSDRDSSYFWRGVDPGR